VMWTPIESLTLRSDDTLAHCSQISVWPAGARPRFGHKLVV
jgi:hypothetical protein